MQFIFSGRDRCSRMLSSMSIWRSNLYSYRLTECGWKIYTNTFHILLNWARRRTVSYYIDHMKYIRCNRRRHILWTKASARVCIRCVLMINFVQIYLMCWACVLRRASHHIAHCHPSCQWMHGAINLGCQHFTSAHRHIHSVTKCSKVNQIKESCSNEIWHGMNEWMNECATNICAVECAASERNPCSYFVLFY